MTQLMVSVRNCAEAEIALAGGADLLDIKEPLRGSLGCAGPLAWESIRQAVGGRVRLSAALGELLEDDVASVAPLAAGFSFAKVGLAGAAGVPRWQQRWRTATANCPSPLVAVVYADVEKAASPDPREILALAVRQRCAAVLVDTWTKQHPLLHWWSEQTLRDFASAVRKTGAALAVAGGLTRDCLEEVIRLARPDLVAVRGAACAAGRDGEIRAELVAALAAAVWGARRAGLAGAGNSCRFA